MANKRFDISKLAGDEPTTSSNAWLTSFADLISIIVTFFVLVYSMSELSTSKWNEVSASIVEFIRGSKINIKLEKVEKSAEVKKPKILKNAYDQFYLENLMNEVVLDEPVFQELLKDGVIKLIKTEKKVTFSIAQSILVEVQKDGGIIATTLGEQLLYSLSKLMKALSNQVEVETLNNDNIKALKISNFIAGKLEELGYEYKALRIYNDEFDHSKNRVNITVNSYETLY